MHTGFGAELTALDRRLLASLVIPPRARILRLVALLVAHSGDSLLWVLAAGAALLLAEAPWQAAGLRVLIGTVVAGGVTVVLKRLVRRPRPQGTRGGLYARHDHHSFPSGHAVRGATTVVLLAPLFTPWGWVALPGWAFLVGLARIALGVHYPTDIVGGWGIGAVVGMLLLCFF